MPSKARSCHVNMQSRQHRLHQLNQRAKFDATILGGGINGACVYDHLCRRGYRVPLLDRGDFASGTSQASAMMLWGGLLYLRNLDLVTVFKLCCSRDRMINAMPHRVNPQFLRYLPSRRGGRRRPFVYTALWFCWLMSLMRRKPPRTESLFPELALLQDDLVSGSLLYEEAGLHESDARFVLQWISSHQSDDCIALN